MFLIYNHVLRLYWSNEDGWGAPVNATRFSEGEKQSLTLPLFGEWVTEDHAADWIDLFD